MNTKFSTVNTKIDVGQLNNWENSYKKKKNLEKNEQGFMPNIQND